MSGTIGTTGTSEGFEEELRLAVDAAERAGRVILRHYQSDLRPESKQDGSPVTAADREGEEILRGLIEARSGLIRIRPHLSSGQLPQRTARFGLLARDRTQQRFETPAKPPGFGHGSTSGVGSGSTSDTASVTASSSRAGSSSPRGASS